MKIAFVLFDGVTFLDFVGFYDVVNRMNQFEQATPTSWDICGMSEEVEDEKGIAVRIHKVRPDLSAYDLLFVPGGLGTRKLQHDEDFIDWLRQAEDVPYKVSVCTGSLLLGAAGFLKGKAATTHPNQYDLLRGYCQDVIETRIVKDGSTITGGGVSTSIDMGLFLIKLLLGDEAATAIQKQIDYPYCMQGIVEV